MNTPKLTKYIDIAIPVERCNFRCSYCYIAQRHTFNNKENFEYSEEHVAKGLSKQRLGGTCLINLCGIGETLFSEYPINLAKLLLQEGHFVIIVTNGCAKDSAYSALASFPKELLSRLIVKFSFHYIQLKKLNLFNKYWEHVHQIKNAGASISIELCPSDETMPYKDEIKAMCTKEVGALPHITIPRDERTDGYKILTELSNKDFINFWSDFNSEMFEIKYKSFGIKRTEFCYAGLWSIYCNAGNGFAFYCHCTENLPCDIFKNIKEPIPFRAVGRCKAPYCVNAHCGMCLGCLPDVRVMDFASTRDRICTDGSHWLTPECRAFLTQKLYDNNPLLTVFKQHKIIKEQNKKPFKYYKYKILSKITFGNMKKKYKKKLEKFKR